MNLILSAVNLFALLVGAFSLYFYRQVVEWHLNQRLGQNFLRYAVFLALAALVSSVSAFLPKVLDNDPWSNVATHWLITIVAGNILIATLNGAALYSLNVLRYQLPYVALSNLSVWGGLGISVALSRITTPNAVHWLSGLLLGQALSLVLAMAYLRKAISTSGHAENSGGAQAAIAPDLTWRSMTSFSWPLLVCTLLYWIQRNSFAPLMASRSTTELLGLFSVAFSVGLLVMNAFDTLFREFYAPVYYRAIANASHTQKVLAWESYADAFIPAILVMFVFVGAVANLLLRTLVGSSFNHLETTVAWGAASQALISTYSLLVLLASSFMDNRVLLIPNLLGAALTVTLLTILLPLDPMAGAAIAINMGLLATTSITCYQLRKAYRVQLPVRRTMSAFFLATPLLVIPWANAFIPTTAAASVIEAVALMLLAGLYTVAIQYKVAKPWLCTRVAT